MLNKNKHKSGGGFTLIEAIVSIFVISVGIIGVFGLAQRVLVISSFSANRLTAAYLSQEGIEIVRNIRDGNWLEQRTNPLLAWDAGIPVGSFEADYNSQSLTQSYQSNFLNIDSSGFYGYGQGLATKFKRKITIQKPDANTINIVAEISWSERQREHKESAEENLYNWK